MSIVSVYLVALSLRPSAWTFFFLFGPSQRNRRDAMKQAGGDKDKDMGKDMGKDKGDKKGDGKPKFKCAKCHLVSYCSDQCQFRDITKHQPYCKSLEEQAHHRALNEAFMKACYTGILRLLKTMLEERGADANYICRY